MRVNAFGFAFLSLALASPAAAAAPPIFTPESFRSHVAFLADDRLEGRDTGSRGYDLAALYVASRFEALGLKPAGKDGWYQPIPFLESRLAGEAGSVAIGGRRFLHGQEIVLSPTPEGARIAIEAPAVFAGYGLEAPELGIEDYRGLDVRGKVVVVLNGFPKGMKSDVAPTSIRRNDGSPPAAARSG